MIDELYTFFVDYIEKNKEKDYTRPILTKEEFIKEFESHIDFKNYWSQKFIRHINKNERKIN